MIRYVLQVDIQYENGDQDILKKEFKSEEDAIFIYEKSKSFFTVGSADKLKEVFDIKEKNFYFRGVPRLFKENIVREEYKI